MAKKVNLYRVTLSTDNSTVADRIDFNDPGKSDLKDRKVENAWLDGGVERPRTEGFADNQPAEQRSGDKQPVGEAEDRFILKGIISKTDGNNGDGQNAFLNKLETWWAEPKKSSAWPEGRFGLVDDNDHTNDIAPVRTGSNQIGLILVAFRKKQILKLNYTEITLELVASRGDGA